MSALVTMSLIVQINTFWLRNNTYLVISLRYQFQYILIHINLRSAALTPFLLHTAMQWCATKINMVLYHVQYH